MPVTLEMTLDGIVQTHAGEPDDKEFLQLVITSILQADDPALILAPMIRGYLIGRKRALVRAKEHAVFHPPLVTGAAAVAAGSPLMAARLQPLLDEVIHIPGYGKVKWGEATIPQLEARAAMYIRQRDALTRTILDVESVIEVIQAHPGATCLNDIYQ